jgi:iron complex outermembrane receptor protein
MFFSSNADKRFVRKLLCGASLSAIAIATMGQSMAQDVQTESVTVSATGTLVKGIGPVGSNLVTIDADAMKSTGALTTNQILEQVPQLSNAFNSNAVAPTAGNFSGFRPQIRNLPSQTIVGGAATLLLLDGHNFVGLSGLGTAPDAAVIPTIVLRQVDVLPDGASSVYGANAITGVINFITRDTFSGLQLNADVGVADSYNSFNTSAIAGTTWEGGGVYLAVEHKENTFLMGADRAYTKMDLTSAGGRDSRGTACSLPNIAAGTRNYAQTGFPGTGAGSLAANVSGPYGGLNPVSNAGSINRCDTNAVTSIFPADNETGLFGSLRQKITDGVEFSMKVLWNTRLQRSRSPMPTATGTIDNTNPYFQSLGGETQQTVQFSFAPFYGKDTQESTNDVQVFQITPQVTAQLPFGDWEATLMGNYGRSYTNTFARTISTTLLNQALRQQPGGPNLVAGVNAFDPYNINQSNSFLVNNILNYESAPVATQHQLQYQLSANGTLFELPGGPVKAALGGKYDWEDYNATWHTNAPIGQAAGPPVLGSQFQPQAIHRVVESGFGEVHVPVFGEGNRIPFVYSLELDASGRIDSYSDFGQTNNFKLGVSYQPFEELTIRGSRGTSYDAPSLADTLAPDGRYQLSTYGSSPNAIVPPGTSPADALRPSILVPGGNPNLGPELGSSWSIGGDFRPTEHFGIDFTGLDFSITAYHIRIEHQIGLAPFNQPLLFQVPGYSKYYIINPTPQQASVYGYSALVNFPGSTLDSAWAPGQTQPYILYDARRNNLGNSVLAGLDFAGTYTAETAIGVLSTGFNGTVSTQNENQPDSTSAFQSIQASGVPLYALSGFAQLNTGAWNFRSSVQYTPSFRVNPGTQAFTLYNQQRIGAYYTVNAHVGYDLSNLASWTNNAEVGVTVNNLFDNDPPIYLHGGSALPANNGPGIVASGSTLGRYVVLSVQKAF